MIINKTVINSIFTTLGLLFCNTLVLGSGNYISTENNYDLFPLVSNNASGPLFVSSQDYPGVLRVAGHLQEDINKVTGIKPQLVTGKVSGNTVVIIGTIGKSPVIDKLAKEKKISAEKVAGLWDTYALETVDEPLHGVDHALVIYGSDKRGTIYGMYDLSKQIGVSPWYWWADVPVKKKKEIYVKSGFHSPGEPKIKYRGIFINDERPCLLKWSYEKFGGWNHKFYDKVFELIMRNRGNFLWPAMWYERGSDWNVPAFFADDPENHRLADEYGVVMSTSHHEPMMCAHHEWHRIHGGEWNYRANKDKLQKFWRNGIERMGNYESVVTLGMRGDGDWDVPGGMQVDLLKTIIADQREIIASVTGKPAEETPQVWAIYKEVQGHYDKGIRPDDDVTILFCDDNWGNIKCFPKKEDLNRKGGLGIYYHFDYVGSPLSYKWTNVTQIERVWEQMSLAYQRGARKLWIVNVGDIKPHEFPFSFWFDYAWNPEKVNADYVHDYYEKWASQQFGDKFAREIGDILSLYTKYNSRRTPEMINSNTYSLENYREADTIASDYRKLCDRTKAIYNQLPESYKSAFYQLVLFPVETCSNLNEMYVSAAKNKFYVDHGAANSAIFYAEKTKELFFNDETYHRTIHNLEGGKWNHMFAQMHIGRQGWHSSNPNNMPPISYVHASGLAPDLAYYIEYGKGKTAFSPIDGIAYKYHDGFSSFDPVNNQSYYIEIFNKGYDKLNYTLKAKDDWIKLSKQRGAILSAEKVYVSIDWKKAPKGNATGELLVSGAGQEYSVKVPIRNDLPKAAGFVENNGMVSIEAVNYDKAVSGGNVGWITIPNLGRTGSAVTNYPGNAERQFTVESADNANSVLLEAEGGLLGSRWRIGSATDASNNRYVEISPTYNGSGSSPGDISDDSIVTYDFSIPESGNYCFMFQLCSDNGDDDSFFWRIDGGKWVLENGRYGAGQWFISNNSQVDNLRKGNHQLQVTYRENGTRLDKFAFQREMTGPSGDLPHLEYTFTIFDRKDIEVSAYLSPSYNFNRNDGLKFAVSIDDRESQIVNIHEGSNYWSKRVGDNIAIKTTKHKALAPGKHKLKIWMIDSGVVFQKFVINAGGLKSSYLGPPESVYIDSSSR